MKHYVVVLDWAGDDAEGVEIFGVTHTYEEAKEIFAKHVTEEKELAEENGWVIATDTDAEFEAYEDGYYTATHSALYIKEMN